MLRQRYASVTPLDATIIGRRFNADSPKDQNDHNAQALRGRYAALRVCYAALRVCYAALRQRYASVTPLNATIIGRRFNADSPKEKWAGMDDPFVRLE